MQNKVVVKQNQKTLSFLFIGRTLNNTQALSMIKNMSVEERTILLKELKKVETLKEVEIMVPKWTELKQLSYHNSLPFIGFGFLDNFIMIVAGEYIDLTLGKFIIIFFVVSILSHREKNPLDNLEQIDLWRPINFQVCDWV